MSSGILPRTAAAAVESPIVGPHDLGPTHGGRNDDYPWDAFDSDAYFNHNYRQPRADDKQLLSLVRDFFAGNPTPPDALGIDVGAGANLYPTLCMLPFCRRIILWERSRSNVFWLRKQLRRHGPAWDQFWDLLSAVRPYGLLTDPWTELQTRARVRRASLFTLPEQQFDVGTMFFVAESMSTWTHQFEAAVSRFLGSLRPGAAFAAAFMRNSKGYRVGDIDFPAVPVDGVDIEQAMAKTAKIHELIEIDKGDKPLREHYDGMLLVTGWRG